MIKTIELNGVKYEVDTEADIPPWKWYIDDDYPITPPEQCSFPITDPCCQLILSCSDPSEAARLGVPVTDDISEKGKKLLSGEPPHLIDYFPGAGRLIREGRIYTEADLRDAFEQSRLTHPMVGFKHDTFEDYLKWKGETKW